MSDLIKLSEPDKLKKTIFIYPEGVFPNIYLQDLNNFSLFLKKIFS